ncbi:hypothetical protein D6D21_05792 [Aureobasidium pullulans]|uniref:Uncharacterized protein n=1 Tax=Aureobasidium pullulans TaxID=5580 RepID=A0AB74IVL3_AURPU|nr:hypothetical protein D6D21_05792 [Aureobasidium pullulans]
MRMSSKNGVPCCRFDWQVIPDGYDSPKEDDFGEVRSVHSLSEWTRSHAAEAVRVLGKTNTRLSQPEVRMVVWPASIRHTDAELRAIWKFYNDSCHLLAPYAFTLLKRPYAEFSWVIHSTRKRFPSLRNATRGSTASHPPVQQSTRALVADNNTPPSRSSAVESARQTESQNGRQPGSVTEEQPPARKSNNPISSAEVCPGLPALAASTRRKRQESSQADIAATSLGPSRFMNGPSPSPRASHNSRDEESHTPLQLVHSTRSQTTATKDDAFCASPISDSPKVSSHSRTTQSGRSARPSSTRQSRLPTSPVLDATSSATPHPPGRPALSHRFTKSPGFTAPTLAAADPKQESSQISIHPIQPNIAQSRPEITESNHISTGSANLPLRVEDGLDGSSSAKTSYHTSSSHVVSSPSSQALHTNSGTIQSKGDSPLALARQAAVPRFSSSDHSSPTINAGTVSRPNVDASQGNVNEGHKRAKGKGRADHVNVASSQSRSTAKQPLLGSARTSGSTHPPSSSPPSMKTTAHSSELNSEDHQRKEWSLPTTLEKQSAKINSQSDTLISSSSLSVQKAPPECNTCGKFHFAVCLVCSNGGKRHKGTCHDCMDCGQQHKGTCHLCKICNRRHVGECHHCKKCNSRHVTKCRECETCGNWHIGSCIICKICGNRHKGDCVFFRPPPKPQLFSIRFGETDVLPTEEEVKPQKQSGPLSAVKKQHDQSLEKSVRTTLNPALPSKQSTAISSSNGPNETLASCNHCNKQHTTDKSYQKCNCGLCHRVRQGKPPYRWCGSCRKCHRPGNCTDDVKDAGIEKKRKMVDEESEPIASPSREQLGPQPKKKARISKSEGSRGDPINLD